MTKKQFKNLSFGKIVYLDEQAVVDFMQLNNDGEEIKIIKKFSESVAEIDAQASVGKGFLNLAKIKLSGNASYSKNNIVETQLTNTLISSFMEVIKSNNPLIIFLSNIQLFIPKESPAYYRNLIPIINMIDDVNKLQTLNEDERKNFSGVNIHAIEQTLDQLSGYYEFICEDKTNKKMIIRFNISGLRNNYNLNDLTKMNLKLFGIKVGESTDANLTFTHQIDTMTQETSKNSIGADYDTIHGNDSNDLNIPIIDILMAGV
ncbi:DUF6414 family protein [Listeria marthii]|nr:DUF6414 family protein [Listeria marthii]